MLPAKCRVRDAPLARNMHCVVQRDIARTTETNMTAQNDNPDRLVSRIEVSARAGSFLGDVRIRLLEVIDVHRSITQAARQVPMSYKAAWDAVDAMNNLARQALVERRTGGRQGGGSRLSAYGRHELALQSGRPACAVFKASSVVPVLT